MVCEENWHPLARELSQVRSSVGLQAGQEQTHRVGMVRVRGFLLTIIEPQWGVRYLISTRFSQISLFQFSRHHPFLTDALLPERSGNGFSLLIQQHS